MEKTDNPINLAPPHLLTRYVFVDTEALRKAQFDWNGRTLSRIVEFATAGQVRFLVTDVIIGEVRSHLKEALNATLEAYKKHEVTLRLLGADRITSALNNITEGQQALEKAFEKFLKDVRAINIPLSIDPSMLLTDYFSKNPPFSQAKKCEFPDAINIHSLKEWCRKNHTKIYVVSSDPDLKACCNLEGPLIHASSLNEIISQATVSTELHAALDNALRHSIELTRSLASDMKGLPVEIERNSFYRGDTIEGIGKIKAVDYAQIYDVRVIDHTDKTFTCEVEFEADIEVSLDVEIAGRYRSDGSYQPTKRSLITQSVTQVITAEVIVIFDLNKPNEVEIESVYAYERSLLIGEDEIDQYAIR